MKSLAVPQNHNELREMLADRQVMSTLLPDPSAFASWIDNYASASRGNDPDILAQVKEQTETFMVNWLKDHRTELDPMVKRLGLHDPMSRVRGKSLYNKSASGAQYDGTFANATELLYYISDQSYKTPDVSRKLGELKNALSSVRPSDGGFLIPEILRAEILRVALENAVVRSRARVIPMDSPVLMFPSIDSTSNASSVYGGVTGYWTEEGATLTESQPRFGRIRLEAQKLCLYTEVPNELLRDARPALEMFIGEIFPEAVAWFEDVAFAVGGGVGEPLGYMNSPSMVQVTRSTTVAGNNIEWVDIANMYGRMLPSSLNRAVWLVSPGAIPNLLTMTVASGSNAVLLGGGAFQNGSVAPPMTILGAPVIVTEKASALGTAGDINFVDLGYYLIGDLQAMSARQSEDYKFQNDVTAYRVIERLDGRPWLRSAITPQNGGDTLSPFVQLTTAA